MDLLTIENNVISALDTAGIPNPINQTHYSVSNDDVADVYYDKTKDPPRLNFCVVNAYRANSERFACGQVLDTSIINVRYYIAINDAVNTHQKMRLDVDTIIDTLDTVFTSNGIVDASQPPQVGEPEEIEIKGFRCLGILITQSVEEMRVVEYD